MPSFYKSHQIQHFFSTEVHIFSVKKNKHQREIGFVLNHPHTEYTDVISLSCFSFIIRSTHDYTNIFFIDLKRIVQSNYWIYKECFDSLGFHPPSTNEPSIKVIWKRSAVTLYGHLTAPGEICQHQPQTPARCELPSVPHTILWAGKAQEKGGHALADGPRAEPWTWMTHSRTTHASVPSPGCERAAGSVPFPS